MALAQKLAKDVAALTEYAGPTDDVLRARAEAAIGRLYLLDGQPEPHVVWCQSLYQYVALPSLLIGIMHGDMWQGISLMLADQEDNLLWRKHWEDAWSEIWANGGYQLLRGMNQTSRIGQQYGELETGLIQQAKDELSRWLLSGKIKQFENGLDKQAIYRQFWAMRLWHKNPIRERLMRGADEIDALFESHVIKRNPAYGQFESYREEVTNMFFAARGSLATLVSRMGAEPENQLWNANFFPTEFPSYALSRIWSNRVEAKTFEPYAETIKIVHELSSSLLSTICLPGVAFVCERPTLCSLSTVGRIHSESGPALRFRDGFATYHWHGIRVDPIVIDEPEKITVSLIESTNNIEMRRILIERYGTSRFLEDAGAQVIQEDEFGVLYRKEIWGDEPLVMVKVVNSTPEPDGTYKDYFLRVPPHMVTARQAVAWTFGIDEESDYVPEAES